MADSGGAHAVIGNHESNALGWATEDPERPGGYLRPHRPKHAAQHRQFLAEAEGRAGEGRSILG